MKQNHTPGWFSAFSQTPGSIGKSRRSLAGRHALLLAFASLGVAGVASAQSAIDGEFSVQRFDPAPGPRNFFTTRGARTDGEMAWSAGLMANYAYKPFVVLSCAGGTDCGAPSGVPGQEGDINVVENLITADVLASLTPIDRLQIGLKVPISITEGDGLNADRTPTDGGLGGVGLGDLTLEVKGRIYGGVKDTFVAGAAGFVTAPLGTTTAEGNFVGDPTVTFGLRGIFDGKEGPLSFGGNLAGIYRGSSRVGSTELGSEFRYGVGAGYDASPTLRIVLDGFGTTKFSSNQGTNTLEIDGGVQFTPLGSPITVSAGGGAGVIEGVGVPVARAFLGVMYVAESRERDGDGIADASDACPTVAEDADGYEDTDGCPDPDNDGDTILDKDDKCRDKAEDPDGFKDTDGCPEPDNDEDGVDDARDACPDKKETKNGFKDDDGCPDEPDADGDGVPDKTDQCADQPEDTDGFKDTDGCPDPDNDGDGVADEEDECVDEPETKNGFKDTDGCPDTVANDKDSDGILDAKDKCPNEAEDKNGVKDDDGCPDALATVSETGIEIRGTVNFANNDTKIIGKPSFDILDAVASIMAAHPEIQQVEVAGHTDDKGNAVKNQKLSEGRAQACKDYLVKKGIADTRLTSKGYGHAKPIADNKTQKGRDQNRRVEFDIVKK